ncbi:hypothetical protein E4T47_00951 [Aureobasidium subglaciale]|nr:hypothetical protein E4T47_00951 [Aureobasidium subglaciale]
MWKERDHADFEIHCGEEKFKVHKAILRAHSDVLAKTCDNHSSEEAQSSVLKLEAHPYKGEIDNLGDDDDPEIVKEMIYYFYHLTLSPKASVVSSRETEHYVEPLLVYLARIYVLAEKWFIEGLEAKVISAFQENLWGQMSHPELVEACLVIYKKTIEPAGERGLKAAVAKFMANDLEEFKEVKALRGTVPGDSQIGRSCLEGGSQVPGFVFWRMQPLWYHCTIGLVI